MSFSPCFEMDLIQNSAVIIRSFFIDFTGDTTWRSLSNAYGQVKNISSTICLYHLVFNHTDLNGFLIFCSSISKLKSATKLNSICFFVEAMYASLKPNNTHTQVYQYFFSFGKSRLKLKYH